MISAYIFYKLARNDGFFMLPRDHEHFAAATIIADDYDHFMQGKKNYSMEELKRSPPNTIARSRYLLKKKLISFDPMAKKTTIRGPLHHLLEIIGP